MKRFGNLLVLSLAIALLLAAGATAKADSLSIDLVEAYQSTEGASVVAFDATVTNDSARTVYLNGDEFYVDSPLVVDDSPFDNTAVWPLTLGPGDSASGLLFNVDIPADTLPDLYTGYFDITGGHYSSNEQFTIGTAVFNVKVTPEPSTLLLLFTGLAGLGGTLRHRRLTR